MPDTEFDLYADEMRKRNEALLGYFCYFGMSVAGVGALMRILLRGGDLFVPFCVMFAGFVVLTLARRKLLDAVHGNSALALYIVQSFAWVMGILLGSVLDPTNRTVTLFLFVALMPVFILDRPRNVLCFNLFWIVLFAVVAWLVKPLDVFVVDMSFLVMFAVAALTTSWLLLKERLSAVRLFVESENHARTDDATGLKNRYALSCDLELYAGSPLICGLSTVDDQRFFVDLYGHAVGDKIMRGWADALKRSFGAERCYRYTAQEMMVILPDASDTDFLDIYRKAQDAFLEQMAQDHLHPTCSMGYVFGTPEEPDELLLMANHADVCLQEAQHAGRMQARGAAFDPNHMDSTRLADVLGGNLQSDSIDTLTGIPNMKAFTLRAQSLMETVVEDDDEVVFIYFDLENFKSYNEDFGFQSGDDLLRSISRILRESFPRRLVARFSDDHFVVMSYLREVDECLAQALNMAYELHGRTNMPLKAGVYVYRDHTEDISVACDRAKAACDSVKSRYDVFWRMYDDELRVADERRQHVISHIDDAIAQGWLRVYYQPIVCAKTREVVECEALVRWIDPVYGFMPPLAFIGELERAHLIHKVDLWIAEHVCADYRARLDAGLRALPVSVNLSRLDFVLCDVEEELLSLTQRYGVPRADLHVEVTESALSEDFSQLVAITNRLRAQGFEIWLDDFGSDYSSLTTLKDFPCDVVKLDLMFLRSFESNERARVIIQQVVELAQRLGARSLAEGVEGPEHLAFLREVGCDLAQGYLISKPEPLEVLVERGLV